MKKITLSLAAAVILFSCENQGGTTENISLSNNIDSVSYAIGVSSATGIKQQFEEGNMDAYLKGFKDVIDSTDLKITNEEAQALIQQFSQKKQVEQAEKRKMEQEQKYASTKTDGEAFLAENKTKEGVVTTASGLQYMVIKKGSGAQPSATSNVEVHYHGTTPDGTVFDSSVDRGETISFALNQVIPGWTEGLQLMKEGAKYKFFIPQELAYGANAPQGGQGPIKPFMPLIFEVELFKINN